ncbi:hypothetical protein OKJ48_10635 [Streptomyces kunmingensis]|uniref:Uncharacterized protein n=1 Tax=Streptomyces kunmingensis TaxID=68225 RepID=A0ABU6C7K3_9ACTN|nr:hypothetical protein [Streptomyces kunmingensis]MEB3960693.1 hypothetical protein [Streptomyces kunmingensis]
MARKTEGGAVQLDDVVKRRYQCGQNRPRDRGDHGATGMHRLTRVQDQTGAETGEASEDEIAQQVPHAERDGGAPETAAGRRRPTSDRDGDGQRENSQQPGRDEECDGLCGSAGPEQQNEYGDFCEDNAERHQPHTGWRHERHIAYRFQE